MSDSPEMAEWKRKHGISDTSAPTDQQSAEARMAEEDKVSTQKHDCIWCGAPFDVKDMRVITRRDDPYIQIDESEADYIPEHNRIHCCQECYKDTYEPSMTVRV